MRLDVRLADWATLLNAFMGVAAITAAAGGDFGTAWHLVFAAIIVDGIDGAIARLGGGGGPLGKTLDMLADTVTFVAAPAMLIILQGDVDPIAFAAGMALLVGGLLRLARFNNQPDDDGFFYGLSTPGATLFVGFAALTAPQTVILVAPLSAAAMLATFRLPKLRGAIGVTGVIIILANLGLFFAPHPWARYSLLAQTAFATVYVAFGSMYVRKRLAGSPA